MGRSATRLVESDLDLADALILDIADTDLRAIGEVTRAIVLRLALRRGPDALESEVEKGDLR